MLAGNAFYLKLVRRQIRLPVVRLYVAAVAVACAVTLSISILSDRFEQHFTDQSKDMLAADLVLQSTTPLTAEQHDLIGAIVLQRAQILTFASMVRSGDAFLLSSVKAVSNDYPLRGELQVSDQLYGEPKEIRHAPARDEVWVEDRVLHELGLHPGDDLQIGSRAFKISRVLVFEPDRGAQFYSFTPRVMMHLDDIASTQIIQPGSRLTYRYLFAGRDRELDELQKRLKPVLLPNQQFVTIESGSEAVADTLQKAFRFLYVIALIAIVLSAIGIALASYKYAQDMVYSYSIMRCLGMNRIQMRKAIWFPFAGFTLISIAAGLIAGFLLHILILGLLGDLVPKDLPVVTGQPFFISAMAAALVATGFSWPFLSRLQNTSPKQLLQPSTGKQPVIYRAMTTMSAGLMCLLFIGTGDLIISLAMLLVIVLMTTVFYFLSLGVIRAISLYIYKASVTQRLGMRLLIANRQWILLQISAIGLTIFSIVLLQTLRDDLLRSWQDKIPADAPNYFVINLLSQELEKFTQQLEEFDIDHSPLYPIVRGRLTAINGQPMREYASKETGRSDESLDRDLALTYAHVLPDDNRIVHGSWYRNSASLNTKTVSVEQGIAENLDIFPGDILEFTIETRKIEAKVTSIRSVEWETFTPNFYMIFHPGALDGLPTTYLTSFHLDPSQRNRVPELIRSFPGATFFDVGFLLDRIQSIVKQLGHAVDLILYFALIAAITVLVAIEFILYEARMYTAAVYKALGATNKILRRVYRYQYLLAGFVAGIVAYAINAVVSISLSEYVIGGDFVFNLKTLLICLVLTPLLVVVTGLISIHRTKNTTPMKLLTQSSGY